MMSNNNMMRKMTPITMPMIVPISLPPIPSDDGVSVVISDVVDDSVVTLGSVSSDGGDGVGSFGLRKHPIESIAEFKI